MKRGAHMPSQRPPFRNPNHPPAPTEPFAEMGMSPMQHLMQEVRERMLLRANASFRRGYVQGWWWGFTCGGVWCGLAAALAVAGWLAWSR
jgi:hypothetical protein